jgi:3-deoxy-7-phosphoheptulonate synthase
VAALVSEGRPGIAGVMLESFLVPGRQSIAGDRSTLTFGQSVTDACLGWEETAATLELLAGAVAARRGSAPPPPGLVRQPVGA